MARDKGQQYIHVYYCAAAGPDGVVPLHDLYSGSECWCEPKCVRIVDTILVVHDQEDGILVVEDKNKPKFLTEG